MSVSRYGLALAPDIRIRQQDWGTDEGQRYAILWAKAIEHGHIIGTAKVFFGPPDTAVRIFADLVVASGGASLRDASVGYLLNVRVAPGHRGRGLGRRLSEAVVTRAEYAGAMSTWLEVGPYYHREPAGDSKADQARLVRLYEGLGFKGAGGRLMVRR